MAWEIMQVLFCEPSLGKVGGGRAGRKNVFLYYNTASFALVPSGLMKNNHLCGTSHMQAGTYDKLKNLAFSVEPPAYPIRPTLRDGH
jgi:hypothetical protein